MQTLGHHISRLEKNFNFIDQGEIKTLDRIVNR